METLNAIHHPELTVLEQRLLHQFADDPILNGLDSPSIDSNRDGIVPALLFFDDEDGSWLVLEGQNQSPQEQISNDDDAEMSSIVDQAYDPQSGGRIQMLRVAAPVETLMQLRRQLIMNGRIA